MTTTSWLATYYNETKVLHLDKVDYISLMLKRMFKTEGFEKPTEDKNLKFMENRSPEWVQKVLKSKIGSVVQFYSLKICDLEDNKEKKNKKMK